jgi:beta-lactam-binding protein with PASTA domain
MKAVLSRTMTRSRMNFGLAAVGLLLAVGCSSAPTDDRKAAGADSGGKVAVPDLVGDTMDTVYDQLEKVGLVASAGTPLGVSDWTDKAVVLNTTPASGTRVTPGSTVKILEATEAEIRFFSKPMPNVVGTRWLGAASGDLEAAYFYFDATWRKPRGKEKPGNIVAQEPKPGAKLKMGQTLHVTVADFAPVDSKSGGNVTIPDVNLPNLCRHTKWC